MKRVWRWILAAGAAVTLGVGIVSIGGCKQEPTPKADDGSLPVVFYNYLPGPIAAVRINGKVLEVNAKAAAAQGFDKSGPHCCLSLKPDKRPLEAALIPVDNGQRGEPMAWQASVGYPWPQKPRHVVLHLTAYRLVIEITDKDVADIAPLNERRIAALQFFPPLDEDGGSDGVGVESTDRASSDDVVSDGDNK